MPHIPFASSTRRARSHFFRSRQRQREASYSRQQHRHQPQLCSFEEARASSFPNLVQAIMSFLQILSYPHLLSYWGERQVAGSSGPAGCLRKRASLHQPVALKTANKALCCCPLAVRVNGQRSTAHVSVFSSSWLSWGYVFREFTCLSALCVCVCVHAHTHTHTRRSNK